MDKEAFNIRTELLRPETVKLAEVELRETPEVRDAAIIELRQLLQEATDLHYKSTDEFLLIFLRACHFYPKSALEKMRKTAEFRKENVALVRGLMPEMVKSQFVDNEVVNILKNCDQEGRRVLIVNVGQLWDTNKVTSDDLFKMFYIIHIAAQLEPETQVRGCIVVMDFEGLGMKQIKAMSPSFSKRLLTFIQDAMPIRLKAVHIVKQPFMFKLVWSLFKPFIQEKLNKRMHFHGSDMKSLHKFITPELLPANYGGVQPKIDYSGKEWYPSIETHIDYVSEWGDFGYAKWD